MNACRYGSDGKNSTVTLQFMFDEQDFTFRIQDAGDGVEKVSAEELKAIVSRNSKEIDDLTKTCGRGLALISSLWTDGLDIAPSDLGGISVTFTKRISSESPPPPVIIPKSLPAEPARVAQSDKTEASPVLPKGPAETVAVSGEVDQESIKPILKTVEEKIAELPEQGMLILDMKELTYFNSTFIGNLAHWHNELQSKQAQLVLRNTSHEVRDILKLVGLDKVIYIES